MLTNEQIEEHMKTLAGYVDATQAGKAKEEAEITRVALILFTNFLVNMNSIAMTLQRMDKYGISTYTKGE